MALERASASSDERPGEDAGGRRLFRREAIEHATVHQFGSVLLARPLSYTLLTCLFAAFAVALVALFAGFSYTRKAHVSGVLMPNKGLLPVLPPAGGIVAERRGRLGQIVKPGDLLFVVKSEHSTASGEVSSVVRQLLTKRQESLRQDLDELHRQTVSRLNAARQRDREMAAETALLRERISLQQSRVEVAEQLVARSTDLQHAGFISEMRLRDLQVDRLEQKQRLAENQLALAGHLRALETHRAETHNLELQFARDEQAVIRNIADAAQQLVENAGRGEVLVRAPVAGTLSSVSAEQGQWVTPGQPMATLVAADAELEAELYAPSRSAGFIKPGMEVLLRYQPFFYQKFGQARGRVVEMSSAALLPGELPQYVASGRSSAAPSEPVYRVRVRLDRQTVTAYGQEQLLTTGTAVDASILLETRRLYEWVLEPLYTISGRI